MMIDIGHIKISGCLSSSNYNSRERRVYIIPIKLTHQRITELKITLKSTNIERIITSKFSFQFFSMMMKRLHSGIKTNLEIIEPIEKSNHNK